MCSVKSCGRVARRTSPAGGEHNGEAEQDGSHRRGALTNPERQRLRQLEQAEQQRQRSRQQAAAQKGGGKQSGQGFGRRSRRRGGKGGRGGKGDKGTKEH